MVTISATAASRGFSDVLDRVERGETVRITRGGHVIAELRPAAPTTGRALREALAKLPALDDDDEFAAGIEATRRLLTAPEPATWPED